MKRGWGRNPWIWIIWALVDGLAVAGAWIYPVKLTGFLLIQAAVIIFGLRRKKDEVWFVAGAILGPMAEAAAVAGGAWKYATPFVLDLPIWLPVLWGLAALLGRRVVEEWK